MASLDCMAASILAASSRAGTIIETLGHAVGGLSVATTESSDRHSKVTSDGATPATQNEKISHPPTRITSDIDMRSIFECRSSDCQSGADRATNQRWILQRSILEGDGTSTRALERRQSVM